MMLFLNIQEYTLITILYFNTRQLEWRDGTYVTNFINKMNTDNDPRRNIWFRTVTGGQNVFQGIESGYPITTEYQVGAYKL
jgi:hypothetical protein